MDMSPQDVSPLDGALEYMVIALLCVGPIGLIVFRKHLKEARGGMRVFKVILQCLAAISAPFAILLTLVILLVLFVAGRDLWEWAMAAW
jgi:ABC-type methionine transport system permease subunit